MYSPTVYSDPCSPLMYDSEQLFMHSPDVLYPRDVDLAWYDLNLQVSTVNDLCGETSVKNILSGCWGCICSSELCGVLGPSGSGKTSMLNALAGRSVGSGIKVDCALYVCGERVDPFKNRKRIAYLTQEDGLMATTTPREALTFSAHLRLPPACKEETDRRVEDMIAELDLKGCADAMIGGGRIAGISGGERKRISVGIELIVEPSLFLLDEPLSGLDSYTAQSVMNLLNKVAERAAVLCTVHQPSSRIFYLFKKIIIMKDGRIWFQGPTSTILNWLDCFGFTCPKNFNPGDFAIDVLQTHSYEHLRDIGMMMHPAVHPEDDENFYDPRSSSVTVLEGWQLSSPTIGKISLIQMDESLNSASFWKECSCLMYREFLNMIRNRPALKARFGVTISISVLLSVIFFQVGKRDNADTESFQTHNGAITILGISAMFSSAVPVLLEFPSERTMFLREHSSGTYGGAAYFISKGMVELPVSLFQHSLHFLIVYWSMHLNGEFIYFVLAVWMTALASASLASLAGVLLHDPRQAMEIAPMLFVPQTMFAGFFIPMNQIPIWLRWMQFTCSLKYGINLLLMNEFSLSLASCKGDAKKNCEQLLLDNSVNASMWYFDVSILVLIYFVFRVAACVALVYTVK